MMTLDEAIAHAEWAAQNCEDECSDEHRQLAEWLRELRELRESVARLSESRNNMLKEHMYLEESLCESRQANEHLHRENRRCRDIIKIRYPNAALAVGELLRENAKLRKLVNDMWICISHGSEGWDCTGCRRDPDSVCIMGISEFSQRMRELGIEVR